MKGKTVKMEEYEELQNLADDRMQEIAELSEQLRVLGKRYDSELEKSLTLQKNLKKME